MTDFLPADPSQRDVLRLGLLSSAVGLTLLAFILENVPKTRHVYLRLSDSEHVTGSVTESPEEVASIWSRLFFSYMNPLMSLGHSKGYLEQSDLPTLNKTEQAHMLSKKFGEVWEQELRKGANASLVRASFKVVGLYFLSAAPLKLMQDLLSFLQPTLLRFLIDFARSHMDTTPKLFGFSFGSADNNTPSKTEPQPVSVGFIIAVVMFVTAIIQSSALHQYFNICYMTGMRLRGALVTQIYRKALRLSSAARQVSTTGEVVNLMAVDAQRIMDLFTYLHILWSGPFQICMALYLLYGTLGYPVFAGVAIMIFAIPLNAYLAKVSRSLQKTQMTTRDVRVKMMDELLSGIKMIKLYAWEGRFVEKISEVRQKEMNTLRQYALLSAIQSFFFAATPFLVAFSTFALHAMLYPQIPLTSTKVFVSLALFNLLQFPLVMFPSVISSSVEASVAFSRLRKFLVNEELDPNAVTFEPFPKNGLPNGAGTIKGNKPYLVEVSQGSFQWGSPTANNSTLTLRSIDLRCQNGSLLAVVGPVGSGKSSLLSALLGDMTRVSGSVVVRGQVAYAAQSPWIMNATLRDNVLFGHAFDQAWYDKVLDACGLRSDLLVLPGGDMVEIGERGINLSGGQKARVSLARAVYANADVYFLDDSLSAVDSHVARHIFDNVIGPKGLLKDKARIFVTHAIAFLADMDEICLIEEGQIVESGTYQQLMASKGELHRLISEFGFGKEADEVREGVPEGDRDLLLDIDGVDDDVAPPIEESHSDLVGSQTISAINPSSTVEKTLSDANLSPETPQRRRSRAASMSVNELQRQQQLERAQSQDLSAECQVVTNGTQPAGNGQASGDSKAKGTLMTKETSARGAVSMSVYRIYAESCGYFAVGVYLVVLFLSQATSVAQTFWLADWSKDNDVEQSGPNGSGWTVSWRIGIYGMLGLLFCITSFIQTVYAWVFCAIRSARVLHKEMLENVVRLPQSWFDTTSMGTVLNRFAKDQNMVDETIPRSFMSFFSTVARVAAVLVVDTIATPLFLLFVTPLAYFYYAVSKYYMATSRELKRLDSVSRSPIYAHFQESLGGVSTIRAFGEQDRFVLENEHRIDLNGRAYVSFLGQEANNWASVSYLSLLKQSPSIVSNRWLAMRLELVGSVIIFASAMFAVVEIATAGKIDASVVGLSLSYALSMTQSLNWMVRQSNEIETNIVSVERVKEYVGCFFCEGVVRGCLPPSDARPFVILQIDLPQEAPAHIPNAKPPATWPEKGAITFSDYSTRYRPNLDLVLRQISLDIKPGEKIGLCGRTGSGKSTLALALFRIMEPAEGTIAIDGVDISKIGLYDLRSRLTVVPQDPILFQGTIRTNLDPFGEHDDSTLWNALEAAYLKDAVMELDGKLDANVQQGGDNFSQGQVRLTSGAKLKGLFRKSTNVRLCFTHL